MENTMLELHSELKKGTVHDLPLKEIRTENKKSYFIVTHGKSEYAIQMLDFQKDDPRPDSLRCVVKETKNGKPFFIQDFSMLYRRFYSEGVEYPFTVRRDFTHLAMSYYEVFDAHGFNFRLMLFGGERLYEGQRIRCKVRTLQDYKLILELVEEDKKMEESAPAGYLAEDILKSLDIPENIARWLRISWLASKEIRDSRESFKGNEDKWVLHIIRELDENMEDWIKPGHRYNNVLLDAFLQSCLYLLEGSDFLMRYPGQERQNGQKILSRAAQNAEAFMQALQLIEEGKHVGYIDTQMEKMKKSGYLFQPDKRLRELMCIFNLEQELMEQKMQLIFDIILDGNKAHWRNEPFRSAFIEMLDLFIFATRKNIDRMANVEDAEGGQLLVRIIQALAIQLLLATENDDLDRKLNQSMLYRYLTYVEGGKKEVLLEKAFCSLTETSVNSIDFGWDEIRDLSLMAIKLSAEQQTSGNTSIMPTYQGKKAQMQLADGNLLIQPLERQSDLVPQIPEWMAQWTRTQILLDYPGISAVTPDTKNLLDYQKWWKELELNLMNGTAPVAAAAKRKYRPAQKDKVYVRINRYDPSNPDYLLCTIEDDVYEGEGRISIKNFVRYNLRMDMSAFFSYDGDQYLLLAEVINVDKDGFVELSMRNTVWDYIRQCLEVGSITRCLVMETYKGYYLCVSEYGYSIQVKITPEMPSLAYGSYIDAIIDGARTNGNVEGTYLQQILENFRVQDAFANLIDGFADERVYIEEEEKEDLMQEVQMDETYVIELVHIMDRKAVMETDSIRTYNFLNVARLVALIIEKEDLAEYYTERMKILQMFQQFAINGVMDNEKLMEQSKVNGDMIANYPLLQTRLMELQAISCLDAEGKEAFLWDILSKTNNMRLQQVTRLVLAYNMLTGFSLFEEKEAIRTKLNAILNIEMQTERPRFFGREDQHTEFKSSLVFPAGNRMKPDLNAQTQVIMKVICGFLNSEGGTLYLGVNNEGVACGIDEELPYFKNSSLDSYDLHIRNRIVRKMGVQANSLVKVSYPDAGKRTVYAMEIQPSPYPVKLDDVYYVRQGSSTWPVLGDDLQKFLKNRETEWKNLDLPVEVQAEEQQVLPVVEEQVEAPAEEVPTITVEQRFSYHDDTHIATSRIRRNAIHSWEDGYGEETLCYFHLMPKNEYMLTDEECWDDTLLSLCIQHKEEDGYIILVYESGRIVKVPVGELLDKARWKKYKRCRDENLCFACPAAADDALLTVVKDNNDNLCYRLDDVANLKEGNMSDKGECLSNVYLKSVVLCDLLPKKYHADMKKIHNLRSTNLGNMLTWEWAGDELMLLEKLGLKV